MSVDSSYTFRRARSDDLALLGRWRAMPHVVEWWGAPSIEPEAEKLDDPNIRMWIVAHAGVSFAFAQDYDPHAWANHPFAHLPPGARGIDQYIGEPDMLDRGHGSAFIARHVGDLVADGAPAVGTDPHPRNLRARRCYAKAGFVETSGPVETMWGTAVLMEYRRPEAAGRRSHC